MFFYDSSKTRFCRKDAWVVLFSTTVYYCWGPLVRYSLRRLRVSLLAPPPRSVEAEAKAAKGMTDLHGQLGSYSVASGA